MLTTFWVLKKGTVTAVFLLSSNFWRTYYIFDSNIQFFFFIKFIAVNDFGSYTSEFCCGFISFCWPFIFRVKYPAITMVATPQVLILNFSVWLWQNGIFKLMLVIWTMYVLLKSISSTDKSLFWILRCAYCTQDEQMVLRESRTTQTDCLLLCYTNTRHLKEDTETARNFSCGIILRPPDCCQDGGFRFTM